MKNVTIVNVAAQDLEIVLKTGGRKFEHICLTAGTSLSVPENSITDTCLELKKRQLINIH